MKQYIFILIILVIVVGCKKTPVINITDLQFGNVDKEFLALNRVEETYLISNNELLNLGESDTFGLRTYDYKGNLLHESIRELMGYSIGYQYDSTGLVEFKRYQTDFLAAYKASYKFVADSLLLYQYWKGSDQDTCVFKFSNEGKIILSIEYANDDHARGDKYKTEYEYNNSGQLQKKTIYLLANNEEIQRYESDYGRPLSTKNVTIYHYTHYMLDSTITTFYFPTRPYSNYNSKTYYNDVGLMKRTIEKDTIVTHYVHKIRTE